MKLGIVGAGIIVQEFLPKLVKLEGMEVVGIQSIPADRENLEKLIPAFVAGVRENDLDKDFGDEWLRTLGIILADDCHEKLHYPLKVTGLCYGEVSYEDVDGYSDDDPSQGY